MSPTPNPSLLGDVPSHPTHSQYMHLFLWGRAPPSTIARLFHLPLWDLCIFVWTIWDISSNHVSVLLLYLLLAFYTRHAHTADYLSQSLPCPRLLFYLPISHWTDTHCCSCVTGGGTTITYLPITDLLRPTTFPSPHTDIVIVDYFILPNFNAIIPHHHSLFHVGPTDRPTCATIIVPHLCVCLSAHPCYPTIFPHCYYMPHPIVGQTGGGDSSVTAAALHCYFYLGCLCYLLPFCYLTALHFSHFDLFFVVHSLVVSSTTLVYRCGLGPGLIILT